MHRFRAYILGQNPALHCISEDKGIRKVILNARGSILVGVVHWDHVSGLDPLRHVGVISSIVSKKSGTNATSICSSGRPSS